MAKNIHWCGYFGEQFDKVKMSLISRPEPPNPKCVPKRCIQASHISCRDKALETDDMSLSKEMAQ